MYVHAFSYGNRIRRSSTLIIVRLVFVAIATVGYWYRRRKRRGREEEEKEERRVRGGERGEEEEEEVRRAGATVRPYANYRNNVYARYRNELRTPRRLLYVKIVIDRSVNKFHLLK